MIEKEDNGKCGRHTTASKGDNSSTTEASAKRFFTEWSVEMAEIAVSSMMRFSRDI
jgi:hypothetical protein